MHLADALEAEALEDRPRHRAALGDQRRRSEGDRVVPARAEQRAVGTAAAGARRASRRRRAAGRARSARPCRRRRSRRRARPRACTFTVSRQSCREERASPRRSRPAWQPNASHCTALAAAYSSNVSTRRAAKPGRGAGGSLRQHERDCVRLLVGTSPRSSSASTSPGGSPSCRPPIASASRPRSRRSAARPPRAPRRSRPRGSAAAGRCSRSCPGRGRACSGRVSIRSSRRPERAEASSGTRRSRAACSDATGCDGAVTRASWARCARVGGWRV